MREPLKKGGRILAGTTLGCSIRDPEKVTRRMIGYPEGCTFREYPRARPWKVWDVFSCKH